MHTWTRKSPLDFGSHLDLEYLNTNPDPDPGYGVPYQDQIRCGGCIRSPIAVVWFVLMLHIVMHATVRICLFERFRVIWRETDFITSQAARYCWPCYKGDCRSQCPHCWPAPHSPETHNRFRQNLKHMRTGSSRDRATHSSGKYVTLHYIRTI